MNSPTLSQHRNFSRHSTLLTCILKKRAKAYIAAGNTLIFDSTGSSDQLGPGQYISPTFNDWPGEWDCAILTSDPAAWNLANKMWVAATDGCDPPLPLWWNPGGECIGRGVVKTLLQPLYSISFLCTDMFSKLPTGPHT